MLLKMFACKRSHWTWAAWS